MPALRRNLTARDVCPFCSNEGWVCLKDSPAIGRYNAVAPCGWCEIGHAKHEARPWLLWNYAAAEVEYTGVASFSMSPDERKALRRMHEQIADQLDLGLSSEEVRTAVLVERAKAHG